MLVVKATKYSPPKRRLTEKLFSDTDIESIKRLIVALAPGDGPDDVALMEWPTLTFVFFSGSSELAQVGYLSGWLRWDGWPGDRRLLDPSAVTTWLRDRAHLA